MRSRRANHFISLVAYLQFVYYPHISLGSPVPTTVFPQILEERSNDGYLVVTIRAGHTLTLRKASVLPPKLEVTMLEDNRKTIHFMSGSRMEEDLYHDPEARAVVLLTRHRGIRLVGILSPTERIQPSAAATYDSRGGVPHDVLPLTLNNSVVGTTTDAHLKDSDRQPHSTLAEPSNRTASEVPEPSPGRPFYPLNGTCETRIAVDSTYFNLFGNDVKKLTQYLAVLVGFTNLKLGTFQENILRIQLVVTGITVFLRTSEDKFLTRLEEHPSLMLGDTQYRINLYIDNENMFKDDDIVVLLTGLDLSRKHPSTNDIYKGTIGLANLRGACGFYKTAVVEDMPRTFSSAHTMTHEIGHLLGAVHDGDPNEHSSIDPTTCPAEEKKIMSPVQGRDMWNVFSYCSTIQVAEFLRDDDGACLRTNSSSMNTTKLTFDDINRTRVSPDEFCKRNYDERYGNMVHEDYETYTLDKCKISCIKLGSRNVVLVDDAPDGMMCNKTRQRAVCINGKCTRVKHNSVQTFGSDVKDSVDFQH